MFALVYVLCLALILVSLSMALVYFIKLDSPKETMSEIAEQLNRRNWDYSIVDKNTIMVYGKYKNGSHWFSRLYLKINNTNIDFVDVLGAKISPTVEKNLAFAELKNILNVL